MENAIIIQIKNVRSLKLQSKMWHIRKTNIPFHSILLSNRFNQDDFFLFPKQNYTGFIPRSEYTSEL